VAESVRTGGATLFSIRVNGQVVFKIQEAPRYFQYFTWTSFQDGVATLEWLPEYSEISLCYTWHPDSLRARGVTFIATAGQDLRLMSGQDIADEYLREPLRPALHFSPRTGWMNDLTGCTTRTASGICFTSIIRTPANGAPCTGIMR
jgi:beta-fructofuranosidase